MTHHHRLAKRPKRPMCWPRGFSPHAAHPRTLSTPSLFFATCEVKVVTSGGDLSHSTLLYFSSYIPESARTNVVLLGAGQASNQEYPVGSYYASAMTDHISTNLPDRSDGNCLLGSGVPS